MKNKRLYIIIGFFIIMSFCCCTNTSGLSSWHTTPEMFATSMEEKMQKASRTSHTGTMQDPIPQGEYTDFPIYTRDKSDNRHNYDIRMNVNYSLRGDAALDLYNTFLKQESDYYGSSYRGEKEYLPGRGNEMMLINITVGVTTKDNWEVPLNIVPTHFDLVTTNGIKVSSHDDTGFGYFKYFELLDYEIMPGGEVTANLVYEVPKGKDILLGYVEHWFKTTRQKQFPGNNT